MIPFRQKLETAFRDHAGLGCACLVYVAVFIALSVYVDVPARDYAAALLTFIYLTGMATVLAGAGILTCAALFWIRDSHAARTWLGSYRMAYGFSSFCVMALFLFLIGAQKSLFPYINPFSWDPFFAELDHALHLSHHPYQLVVPMVEAFGEIGIRTIVGAYAAWFPAIFITCFYAAFIDASLHRSMRFVWAYALSWLLLGVFAALAFSSVGPLFYQDFYAGQPDPFAPLVDDVYGAEGKAGIFQATRAALLGWVRDERILSFNSLSAMPSLHVGMAWLFALYWQQVNRWAGAVAWAFFALILVGSVYLGFHYAIDGYAAMLGITLIWLASARIVRRLHPSPPDLRA